jgi:hypothetical protein
MERTPQNGSKIRSTSKVSDVSVHAMKISKKQMN